jgi:hypothetical protein
MAVMSRNYKENHFDFAITRKKGGCFEALTVLALKQVYELFGPRVLIGIQLREILVRLSVRLMTTKIMSPLLRYR